LNRSARPAEYRLRDLNRKRNWSYRETITIRQGKRIR
jgi:hypothetical protein